VSESGGTNEATEFAEIVKQSQEKIHAQAQTPIKGKRGRPPAPRDANGNIIRDGKTSVDTNQTQQVNSNAQSLNESATDFSPVLIAPLTILSSIPAKKYDVPQLALDRDEAEALAKSIDKLISVYMPDLEKMSPKSAAWLTFGMTSVSIFTSKVYVYSEVMSERRKINSKNRETGRDHASNGVRSSLESDDNSSKNDSQSVREDNLTTRNNPFRKNDPFSKNN